MPINTKCQSGLIGCPVFVHAPLSSDCDSRRGEGEIKRTGGLVSGMGSQEEGGRGEVFQEIKWAAALFKVTDLICIPKAPPPPCHHMTLTEWPASPQAHPTSCSLLPLLTDHNMSVIMCPPGGVMGGAPAPPRMDANVSFGALTAKLAADANRQRLT